MRIETEERVADAMINTSLLTAGGGVTLSIVGALEREILLLEIGVPMTGTATVLFLIGSLWSNRIPPH